MSERPTLPVLPAKTANDRLLMQVLYALHTLAWFSLGTLTVLAVIVNLIKRGQEQDPLYLRHHQYLIRTFGWTLLWLLLASPLWLLFVVPGMLAYAVIGLWYAYRCIKGWLRFNDNRFPDDVPPTY